MSRGLSPRQEDQQDMSVADAERFAVETTVLSGRAFAASPPFAQTFAGAFLQLADVAIVDEIAYAQYSDCLLVHATLRHDRLGAPANARGSSGALSVTPAGQERRGQTAGSHILGAQIAITPDFAADACERTLPDWRARFDVRDDKALTLARAAATAARRGDRLAGETLLLAMARHVGQTYAGAGRRRDDGWINPNALVRVVERLRATDGQQVSLSELATEAGLGISAFSRAFRGSTGHTPMEFALTVRLDRVADLLVATGLPLGEIAAMTGFASASHLVRTFRAKRGVTPARWRGQAR